MVNHVKPIAFMIAAICIPCSFAHSQSRGVVADYVLSETRQLADGNRIERQIVGEYAQDTDGRARLRYGDAIAIVDPVDGVS